MCVGDMVECECETEEVSVVCLRPTGRPGPLSSVQGERGFRLILLEAGRRGVTGSSKTQRDLRRESVRRVGFSGEGFERDGRDPSVDLGSGTGRGYLRSPRPGRGSS